MKECIERRESFHGIELASMHVMKYLKNGLLAKKRGQQGERNQD